MEDHIFAQQTKVYLGLGSNLGDREANLAQALKLMPTEVTIGEVSSIYESEPVGYRDQPWFLNIVSCGYTELNPLRLLDYVKHMEEQLGRMLSFRNAPRPIDIDILFYGDETVETDLLTIPHPRIAERAFVLAPMVELEPDFLHPSKRQTMAQMLSIVPEPKRFRKRNWSPLHSKELFHTPKRRIHAQGPETSFENLQ